MNDDRETLERALTMARRALAILEEQAAGYTALTIPAHLQIELEEKRRQVAELEARLGGATGAPSPARHSERSEESAAASTVLDPAIVRIYTAQGRVAGAGFLAGERRVLTCAHVVAAVLGLPDDAPAAPQAKVQLDFPLLAPGRRFTARVTAWQALADVAGLALTGAPPAGAAPVSLMVAGDLWGHPFRAFGFPAGHENGVWASGRILGRQAGGWVQIEDVKQTGYFVAPGFSGGPVWDETAGGVVGMIVAAERQPGLRAAFLIPTAALRRAWPESGAPEASPAPHPLNPFCDRGRINDPGRFFDRQRTVRELRQMLAAGNSISLVGHSQIGKSSVLYHLYRTRAEWLPAASVLYLDLQGVLDEQDFCAEVLEGLGQEPGDLYALKRALRQGQTVLLLDEVEKLADPAFSPNLQGLLRALAQGPLVLAVASQRPLVEVFPPASSTSPLHNIFTEKRLGPFSAAAARDFLERRLQGSGVAFTPEERERLVTESGGHPARLQQLACDLFEHKRPPD